MENKWYAVKYPNGYWNIQKSPEAINIEKQDVLSHVAMGKEQAEQNAKLCASAPEMREELEKWKAVAKYLYEDIKFGINEEGQKEAIKLYEDALNYKLP